MRILVTGGAGFIGGNFIHYMIDKYQELELICFDALTYAGNLSTLAPVSDNSRFTFVKGDISSVDSVDSVFSQNAFDAVVNFAAEAHVDRSIENPSVFLKTNIIGTQVLMDACLKYKVARFHQISTDEVYGGLPLNRPDLAFDENSPLKASNPYAASKAAADLLVLSYVRTHDLPATISRSSNNYGPYQYPDKLISLMIVLAMVDKPLPVFGDGLNVRDWLHVKDHCAAIDAVLHHGTLGEVYNIGGNCEKDNLEIVSSILDLTSRSKSLITFVEDRPGHDLRYALDSTKAQRELGWKPAMDLDAAGLKDTVNWYKKNQEWWKPFMR